MFLGLEAKGVHINTTGWHIFVMLEGLDEIEVTAIHLGKTVMTIELDLGG
jgi:hypothetical protein